MTSCRSFILLFAGALLVLCAALCRDTLSSSKRPGRSGDAVEIQCIERGMTRITGRKLIELGLDLDGIEPAKMALVHYDQPAPFYGAGLADGRFDPEDAIYFFSAGADRDTVPYVNIEKDGAPRTQRFMLHLGGGSRAPARFKPVAAPSPGIKNQTAATLGGMAHFEENPIYRFIDDDKPFQESTATTAGQAGGTDYIFWKEMTYPPTNKSASTAAVTFDLPQADLKQNVTIRARLFTAADESYVTLEHRVALTINGKPMGAAAWTGVQAGIRTHDAELQVPPGILKESNQIEFEVLEPKILACSRPAKRFAIDFVMLDWIEADFRQPTRVNRDEGEFLVRKRRGSKKTSRLWRWKDSPTRQSASSTSKRASSSRPPPSSSPTSAGRSILHGRPGRRPWPPSPKRRCMHRSQ